nr:hypothetical protein [uncultured Desulfobacter sp.]
MTEDMPSMPKKFVKIWFFSRGGGSFQVPLKKTLTGFLKMKNGGAASWIIYIKIGFHPIILIK